MPCLSTCPDGKHHCAMVHEHGGDHAASGCRWADSRIVKRAQVRRHGPGRWRAWINSPTGSVSHRPFPTHAEALHAALEAVGLTTTNPAPMEAP